jgi:hypothetical protein
MGVVDGDLLSALNLTMDESGIMKYIPQGAKDGLSSLVNTAADKIARARGDKEYLR